MKKLLLLLCSSFGIIALIFLAINFISLGDTETISEAEFLKKVEKTNSFSTSMMMEQLKNE